MGPTDNSRNKVLTTTCCVSISAEAIRSRVRSMWTGRVLATNLQTDVVRLFRRASTIVVDFDEIKF